MIRILSVAAALAASFTLLGATASHAQGAAAHYVATPASTPTKAKLMTRSTPWRLAGNAFVAARAPERDMVLCQLVAKDVGRLSGFSVGGEPYDAAALDKCNAKANAAKVSMAKTDTVTPAAN